MGSYRSLQKQVYKADKYSIVPIRMEDRYDIMKWRSEQMYHLRQNEPLTREKQDIYFETVIFQLFKQEKPGQILFSYLDGEKCIGYGGLVHINWIDKNAEISFVMNTELEEIHFEFHWKKFLYLLEEVAFRELELHKFFTYAFDLRPKLYNALLGAGFYEEAKLKEHCFFNEKFIDVLIHSKIRQEIKFREASFEDAEILFDWVNEKEVRKNSLISKPVKWEDHLTWFKNKMENKNSRIFIFFIEQEPMGQVRLNFDGDYWNIAFSVDPAYRGLGYGKLIIKKIVDLVEFKRFRAIVKKNNIGSLKVFKRLGFEDVEQKSISESEVVEFIKEL